MASVKVVERLRVSPAPLGSVPTTDLALTYFDVRWLASPPNQRLLFYSYDGTADDFRNTYLSAFRRSLSLALTVFYPVAGHLFSTLTENGLEDHVIRYTDGDSVPVYLAESQADFHHLTGNHLKDVKDLHPFVSPLVPVKDESEQQQRTPLLAIQVTVFPFSGVCIGVTFHHVVADGSGFINFLKSWASICKSTVGGGGDISGVKNPPVYDRAVIGDLEELKRNLMLDMRKIRHGANSDLWTPRQPQQNVRILRGTFVLTRSHIDALRQRLTKSSGYDVGPKPSTFTITTAYVWVCAIKAREVIEGESVHFAFAVDCRSRLDPPVPAAYFGNCVKGTFVETSGSELTRENGFFAAAEAIHGAIRNLGEGGGVMKDAGEWIWNGVRVAEKRVLTVASSPRFRVYEADFGWGRPLKVDVVSIEKSGAMSLEECRDEEGGVEIGLVGPDYEMDRFASIFEEGLKKLCAIATPYL